MESFILENKKLPPLEQIKKSKIEPVFEFRSMFK